MHRHTSVCESLKICAVLVVDSCRGFREEPAVWTSLHHGVAFPMTHPQNHSPDWSTPHRKTFSQKQATPSGRFINRWQTYALCSEATTVLAVHSPIQHSYGFHFDLMSMGSVRYLKNKWLSGPVWSHQDGSSVKLHPGLRSLHRPAGSTSLLPNNISKWWKTVAVLQNPLSRR